MAPTTLNGNRKQTTKRIPCLVYTRVCGYPRPIADFNKGKRQEYIERKQIGQE